MGPTWVLSTPATRVHVGPMNLARVWASPVAKGCVKCLQFTYIPIHISAHCSQALRFVVTQYQLCFHIIHERFFPGTGLRSSWICVNKNTRTHCIQSIFPKQIRANRTAWIINGICCTCAAVRIEVGPKTNENMHIPEITLSAHNLQQNSTYLLACSQSCFRLICSFSNEYYEIYWRLLLS